MRKLIATTALALSFALAGSAVAATPGSGRLSRTEGKVKWSGEANGYGLTAINIVTDTAGTVCEQPFCDRFALEIADAGGVFRVSAIDTAGIGFVQIDVVNPDGSVDYYNAAEQGKPTVAEYKDTPAGAYEIRVLTNNPVGLDGSYSANATLTFPGAPVSEPPAQLPAATKLTIKTGKASARKLRKGVRVKLASDGELTGLVATLARKNKKVARGKLARLQGKGSIKLKGRKAKRGRYTLTVTGNDAQGRAVTASRSLKLRK